MLYSLNKHISSRLCRRKDDMDAREESMRFLKILTIVLVIFVQSIDADVDEYKKLYLEENRAFFDAASSVIKKELASPKNADLTEIYKANDFRPIWFDREGLTPNTYRFIDLLEEDRELGDRPRIKATYERLMAQYRTGNMRAQPLEVKVEKEFEVTHLYLDYVGSVLAEKKSKYTPQSLLIYSLQMGSLVFGFNAIVNERLAQRPMKLERKGVLVPDGAGLESTLTRKLASEDGNAWLSKIYGMLENRPVWVGRTGYAKRTRELLGIIQHDASLDPAGAIAKEAAALNDMAKPANDDAAMARELRVMRLYRTYADRHLFGSIDWEKFSKALKRVHPEGVWIPHKILSSPSTFLITAVENDTLKKMFNYSKPPFPMYDRMVAALQHYRRIQSHGGWKNIPATKTLRPGDSSVAVPKLRERLAVEGDYNASATVSAPEKYDDTLVDAVKRFQKRHGLADDGIVGAKTWQAINMPVEEKIARMKLNLDRIKWFKRGKERYHILINIPSFTLYLFDGPEWIERMPVVVGKVKHETPVFYNRVKRITLNPYWRIPASIIRKEMVPKLIADPDYTRKKRIEIHTGPSVESPEVDPRSVDWKQYRGKTPPYYFVQMPGSHNALGKIKYLFPNEYAVYMHDTPAKALFKRSYRAYSHGCIRLSRPVDLLEKFSEMGTGIDFEEAKKLLNENVHKRLYPKLHVPIDTVYLTVWVTQDGTVEFRDDLYGYDALQLASYGDHFQ